MIKIICMLLLACSLSGNASQLVSGTFLTTQSCPAYISKNNKNNPNNFNVETNKHYILKEINKSPPSWYRIETSDAQYALRWVSGDCGIADYAIIDTTICSIEAGHADSYILAMSHQPGFCQTYGYEAGKPECMHLSPNSYQATHLTLHGLWPSQESCGQHYGFCGAEKPKTSHCNYAPVSLTLAVSTNLKKIMPGYNYGSCLERHEWNKHGSCQILNADDYFSLSMRLVQEVDHSAFGNYLSAHKGKVVQLSSLRAVIASTFGANNAGKIYLGCKNGILVDIYIKLPALIPYNEPLETLINAASVYPNRDTCANKVIISDFSKESLY